MLADGPLPHGARAGGGDRRTRGLVALSDTSEATRAGRTDTRRRTRGWSHCQRHVVRSGCRHLATPHHPERRTGTGIGLASQLVVPLRRSRVRALTTPTPAGHPPRSIAGRRGEGQSGQSAGSTGRRSPPWSIGRVTPEAMSTSTARRVRSVDTCVTRPVVSKRPAKVRPAGSAGVGRRFRWETPRLPVRRGST